MGGGLFATPLCVLQKLNYFLEVEMRKIFFITILFASTLLFAQPNYLVDSIVVKISNDTVYVWDYNAWEQCVFQLDYEVDINDSIITITQIDTAEGATTCYGYHNLVVPIVGLSEGSYRIDIYRDCLYEDLKFIKSYDFEYYISGIDHWEVQPNQFILHNAYPNPFNPSTIISYTLPNPGYVTLKVYDLLGDEVSILVSQNQESGTFRVEFNGANLSSGIYFYRLQFHNKIETKKILLLR